MYGPVTGWQPSRYSIACFWIAVTLICMPLFVSFGAVAISKLAGCEIASDGFYTATVPTCPIGGLDFGPLLQDGFFAFLYITLTWPAAFLLAAVWMFVSALKYVLLLCNQSTR